MSLVNIKITVTNSKSGHGDAPAAEEYVIKAEKPSAQTCQNAVVIQVWKDKDCSHRGGVRRYRSCVGQGYMPLCKDHQGGGTCEDK